MPTIALVDDDRNILTSVSIALEAEGYRIQTYTDGASALDGLRHSPPDLAIFDIKMPRMDGMELLRRLRQKSDLPVIFLTSKDEEIDELFRGSRWAPTTSSESRSRSASSSSASRRCCAASPRRTSPRRRRRIRQRPSSTGQLVMDPERHTCTWKGDPVTLTVTEFLNPAGARPAPRRREEPQRPDGRGL